MRLSNIVTAALAALASACTDTPARSSAPPPPSAPPSVPALVGQGGEVYRQNCAVCHYDGLSGENAPPLAGSALVAADDPAGLVKIILSGRQGQRIMPGMPYLTDDEVAAVATWVRHEFANRTDAVPPAAVQRQRAEN